MISWFQNLLFSKVNLYRYSEAAEAGEAAAAVWRDVAAAAKRQGDEPPPPPPRPPGAVDVDGGGSGDGGGGGSGGGGGGVVAVERTALNVGGRDAFWERTNSAAALTQDKHVKTKHHKHDLHGTSKNKGAKVYSRMQRKLVTAMRGGEPKQQTSRLPPPPPIAAEASFADSAATAELPPPRPELGEGVTDALCSIAQAGAPPPTLPFVRLITTRLTYYLTSKRCSN